MYQRLLELTRENSFFLFGPRGSGKSTLLAKTFPSDEALFIDLLDAEQERRFALNPNELIHLAESLTSKQKFIIIDEVQKIPKLLDIVHLLIEKKKCLFALSGSSARKLKRGGANLLAGRAFIFNIFPLSFLEMGADFILKNNLQWGSLPKVFTYKEDISKKRFLFAYANTYLKEEVWAEQLVKNLESFRRFLEISAQCNGKIINYSKIARDTGVEDKTVKTYYDILNDTLIGFNLEAYHPSFRKRFSQKPKFYFYDIGIARTLANLLDLPLKEATSYYGEVFEHFVILEIQKLISYRELNYRLSYLQTTAGVEVDLIIERPGKRTLLVEIKSSTRIQETDLRNLSEIHKDFTHSEALCISNQSDIVKYNDITVYPWREGILYCLS